MRVPIRRNLNHKLWKGKTNNESARHQCRQLLGQVLSVWYAPGGSSGAGFCWENRRRKLWHISQEAVPVSIYEYTLNDLNISIYPNPASNKVYLKSSKDVNSKLVLRLYDATGKLVVLQNVENMVASQSMELDISGFSSGMYLLRLSNKDITISSLLIIK